MAVSYLGHRGQFLTADASNNTSWSCTYAQQAFPKGICVAIMSNLNTDITTGLTMNGVPMDLVDTDIRTGSGMNSTIKAYVLSGNNTSGRAAYWGKTPFNGFFSGTTNAFVNAPKCCAYGNKRWCIGDGATVKSNTDYTGTFSTVYTFTGENVDSLAYGNGYWLAATTAAAAGNSGQQKLYYSTDPTSSWTQVTGVTLPSNTSNDERIHVRYLNGYYLIAALNALYYTADPTGTWTNKSAVLGANETPRDMAYGNGYYVLVSTGSTGVPRTRYTSDLETWQVADTIGGNSITYGRGYWVKGNSGIFYTADITSPSWTTATGTDINITKVKYGNQGYGNSDLQSERGVFYAAGSTGVGRVATDPTGNWISSANGFTTTRYLTYGSDDDAEGSTWMIVGDTGYRYANGIQLIHSKSAATNTFWGMALILNAGADIEVNANDLRKIYRVRDRQEELVLDGNFNLDSNRNAMRIALVTSSGTTNLTTGVNTQDIALGTAATYRHYTYRELNEGQGSRYVGVSTTSLAAESFEMYFAIREKQTQRNLTLNGQYMLYNDGTGLRIVSRSV